MNETWKDIPGFEGLYSINENGEIFSNTENKRIRTSNPDHTYGTVLVQLYKEGYPQIFQVARLVAEAFVPNPDELPIVRHKNGNRKNVCARNLEWCAAG